MLGKWLPTVTISAESLYPLIMTQFRVFVHIMISQGDYGKAHLFTE